MYCKNCGNKLYDFAVYCEACNTPVEESKTNEELLQEVKKLREETEKDNKKKWQNSAYNFMIAAGIVLLAIYFFIRCALQ